MIAPAYTPQSTQPQTLAQAPTPQVDLERKRMMREAWKAFRGEFKPPLKVPTNGVDDNVISNRGEPIVNKVTSFLFGNVLKIEATNEATNDTPGAASTTKPSPIQDHIKGMWGDDDDMMTLLSKWSINGAVCGQVFVKLIPAQEHMKFPRMVTLDPTLIRIVTDPDDCELILAYVIEYPATDNWQKRQIIARIDPDNTSESAGEYDLDDTWTTTTYMKRGQAGAWSIVGPIEPWPYPFAPIFTCQNLPNPNEPWGRPDLTHDLIAQNKVLNFLQSNVSRIIKFHGHPKTWGKGFNAGQLSVGVDEVIIINSENGTLQNLEMKSNLADILAFISVIRDNMDEQSRVPSVALGRLELLPRGQISGVALQMLFQPLIEKTIQRQRLYGKLIREITRAALIITGLIDVADFEDYPIELHWQNLLPVDDTAAAQTALILTQLGVSTETVLAELGYQYDAEAEKNAKEDAKKLKDYSRGVGLPPGQPPMPGQQQQDNQDGGQAA